MAMDFGDDGNPSYRLSRLPLRKIVEEKQSDSAVQLSAERSAIRAAFRTPRGKAALRILTQLFKHQAAYFPDEKMMCFFLGQRAVIEYIEEALSSE